MYEPGIDCSKTCSLVDEPQPNGATSCGNGQVPLNETPGLSPRQVFRYYFKNVADVPASDNVPGHLVALANAIAEPCADDNDSDIPPLFTYLGQFIDHDITANTDREQIDPAGDRFNIDRIDVAPQPRDAVEQFKINLRKGRLELDSVYGDGPGQRPEAMRLEAALRDPNDPAKMRLGDVTPLPTEFGFERPPLPIDQGADLPRVGAAIDDRSLTMAEVEELFDDPDHPKSVRELRQMALIGDCRNDENLIVAQLHLAFLRFHNAVVDQLRANGHGAAEADDVFAETSRQVTWIYQWLVVNSFLPTVCGPAVVTQVVNDRAPVYARFYDTHKNGCPDGVRPMPLEFSVAAIRYGHTMVRATYDYNRNFGRGSSVTGNDRASFEQIFQFAGRGELGGAATLPDNWIIEWDRFIQEAQNPSDRKARKIDTRLALPLQSMRNEKPGMTGLLAHLAARNLRRGYVFNIPDAQAIIQDLADQGIDVGQPLAPDEIANDERQSISEVFDKSDFGERTPLWFYLLKEAEARGSGDHLGPLGSRIVAETLLGLIVTDPASYINQGTFASWTPSDGVQPAGEPVDNFAAFFRAGGLLA
ncbi:MAG: heme peroxidase family protein [Geminicoccaceae bacterium]